MTDSQIHQPLVYQQQHITNPRQTENIVDMGGGGVFFDTTIWVFRNTNGFVNDDPLILELVLAFALTDVESLAKISSNLERSDVSQ